MKVEEENKLFVQDDVVKPKSNLLKAVTLGV
jgi:hypothetical protein